MTYSFSSEPGIVSVVNKDVNKVAPIWETSSFFTLQNKKNIRSSVSATADQSDSETQSLSPG